MSIIDDKIRESREREAKALEPHKHRADASAMAGNTVEYRFRDALEVAVKALRGEWMTLDAYNEIERILDCETLAKGEG